MNPTARTAEPPAHLARGIDAERAALDYLDARGLTLLEKNFRCKHGEIDLIMQQQQELVFVEVRYRQSEEFGGALASITPHKREKLRAAAEAFLSQNASLDFSACRFDAVLLGGDAPAYRIRWIHDAF